MPSLTSVLSVLTAVGEAALLAWHWLEDVNDDAREVAVLRELTTRRKGMDPSDVAEALKHQVSLSLINDTPGALPFFDELKYRSGKVVRELAASVVRRAGRAALQRLGSTPASKQRQMARVFGQALQRGTLPQAAATVVAAYVPNTSGSAYAYKDMGFTDYKGTAFKYRMDADQPTDEELGYIVDNALDGEAWFGPMYYADDEFQEYWNGIKFSLWDRIKSGIGKVAGAIGSTVGQFIPGVGQVAQMVGGLADPEGYQAGSAWGGRALGTVAGLFGGQTPQQQQQQQPQAALPAPAGYGAAQTGAYARDPYGYGRRPSSGYGSYPARYGFPSREQDTRFRAPTGGVYRGYTPAQRHPAYARPTAQRSRSPYGYSASRVSPRTRYPQSQAPYGYPAQGPQPYWGPQGQHARY